MIILDINECDKIIGGILSNGGCEHRCNNTIGTYVCSCYDGYSLTLDEKTCEGIVLKTILL